MNEEEYFNSHELADSIYKTLIRNIRIKAEIVDEIINEEILNNDTRNEAIFDFGLCYHSVKSTSIKKKCHFDIRTQNYIWHESNGMTCKNFCKLSEFRQNVEYIKSNFKKYLHMPQLKKIIKDKLVDFVPKV